MSLGFDSTIILKDPEIVLKKEYFAKRIVAVDSLLIVQTNQNSSLFKVYNAESLKYLNSFGKKGDGPNEFSYPFTNSQFTCDDDGIKLWTNDLWRYKTSLINVSKSIKNNVTVIDKVINHNPKHDFTHDLNHYNNEVFYGNHGPDAIERFRITKYNHSTETVTHAELIPKVDNMNLLNRSSQYALYFDYLGIKPDKSRLVSAMNKFNRIDFYDLDLNLINSYSETDENEITDVKDILHKSGKDLVNLRNYYYSLQCSNSYVYALHRNGQLASENGKKDINVDIRVFDWEGAPKYLLKVPNDLTSFTVDEKNGWIYGVDSYNEKIYRYKINLTT